MSADFDRAVVAIGTDIEASVLTVLALAEAGVADIWAKAITRKHGRILERVGAHHVVYPEFSMGERVAHMLTGRMMDYIEFDDEFSIARTLAPPFTWGKTLAESAPRTHVRGDHRRGEARRRGLHLRPSRDRGARSRPPHRLWTDPQVEKFCNIR